MDGKAIFFLRYIMIFIMLLQATAWQETKGEGANLKPVPIHTSDTNIRDTLRQISTTAEIHPEPVQITVQIHTSDTVRRETINRDTSRKRFAMSEIHPVQSQIHTSDTHQRNTARERFTMSEIHPKPSQIHTSDTYQRDTSREISTTAEIPSEPLHIPTSDTYPKNTLGEISTTAEIQPEPSQIHTSDTYQRDTNVRETSRERSTAEETPHLSTSPYRTERQLTNSTAVEFDLLSRILEPESTPNDSLLELVSFMLRNAKGRHFYLLYDHTTDGVSNSLARIAQRFGDVTVFTYDSRLIALGEAIRGYYHSGYLRNIFVLCSSQNATEIFRKITAENLQTPSIHWYVIDHNDVTDESDLATTIADIIKEGTQVTMATGTGGRYDFLISYVNTNGNTEFKKIGRCNWDPSRESTRKMKIVLNAPLYSPPRDAYRDLRGRVMRSAVINNSPFFKVNVLPNGTVQPEYGIDFNVLNTLGAKLNFSYQLVLTEDGEWGGELPNGSFTGMIGKVQIGDANFAINEITISGVRERVVDFTLPYFLESTTILSPAPAEKNRAFAVFWPFTSEVWLMIVASTLLMGPIIAGATRIRAQYHKGGENKLHTLGDFTFTAFRSLVVQGDRLHPRGWCQRGMAGGWYFFCFIIYALYAGTLTAVLTVPTFEKPIDSLWDLLNAMRDDGYKACLGKGTSNEFLFRLATSGIYKQIWDVFDQENGYIYNWDEGIERVLNGKEVFLNAHLQALIRSKRKGLSKFYFARNTFYPQSYGIACSKGAPYKVVFDSLLLEMGSGGLIQKWTLDEVAKVKEGDKAEKRGPGAITLVHLQAAFFILLMGYSAAATTLVGERLRFSCFERRRHKKSKKLPKKDVYGKDRE